MSAGPKMRKWYGQKSNMPRDGEEPEPPIEQEPEPQQEESAERDYVLVTDADTPTGELVVLQLILLRANIRTLVKDTAAATTGYGPYVEPISVDTNSAGELARALRNVRCVVVLGKLGSILPAAQKAGIQRVVLLSTAGMPQPGGFAALFQNPADAALKEAPREAAVRSSSIPHVVVKAGCIQDVPGGSSSINIAPLNSSSGRSQQCSISREDLASAIVASAVHELPALQRKQGSSAAGLVFEVRDAGPGQPPDNWEQLLNGIPAV
eukprot:GHUV01013502.1.p1 GENE.GHUV01013502.1~~GHUV01013502.1.p1  ORF type:complete len:266 (+),score=88.18 GHUV01013502.1:1977-2774(+)